MSCTYGGNDRTVHGDPKKLNIAFSKLLLIYGVHLRQPLILIVLRPVCNETENRSGADTEEGSNDGVVTNAIPGEVFTGVYEGPIRRAEVSSSQRLAPVARARRVSGNGNIKNSSGWRKFVFLGNFNMTSALGDLVLKLYRSVLATLDDPTELLK
ncbi:hypothetical protein J6590_039813 [Homalodisca vitripennis]|nr:hypothetical protein J6590_039813 [Homalodisca vitripennis]